MSFYEVQVKAVLVYRQSYGSIGEWLPPFMDASNTRDRAQALPTTC